MPDRTDHEGTTDAAASTDGDPPLEDQLSREHEDYLDWQENAGRSSRSSIECLISLAGVGLLLVAAIFRSRNND